MNSKKKARMEVALTIAKLDQVMADVNHGELNKARRVLKSAVDAAPAPLLRLMVASIIAWLDDFSDSEDS